jgi:hypothetical protein
VMIFECLFMDEMFIYEMIFGMKVTATWDQCGVWAKMLKDRLGAV